MVVVRNVSIALSACCGKGSRGVEPVCDTGCTADMCGADSEPGGSISCSRVCPGKTFNACCPMTTLPDVDVNTGNRAMLL